MGCVGFRYVEKYSGDEISNILTMSQETIP